MDRSATIQYQRDGDSAGPQTLATGAFVADEGLASNPIPKLLLRLAFSIPGSGDFVAESGVVPSTGNTSFAVRRTTQPAETLFLAMWLWPAGKDAYFGVRIPSAGTIHVYLQSVPPSEPPRRA